MYLVYFVACYTIKYSILSAKIIDYFNRLFFPNNTGQVSHNDKIINYFNRLILEGMAGAEFIGDNKGKEEMEIEITDDEKNWR